MTFRLLMAAAVALTVTACGDAEPEDTESEFAGSCIAILDGTCSDYTGSIYTPTVVELACPAEFSADPCPDADRTGRCLLEGGTEEEQEWSFYAPDYTTETAEAVCDATEGGSWLGL